MIYWINTLFFFFFLILLFSQTKNKQKLVYIQCLEDMIVMSLQSSLKNSTKVEIPMVVMVIVVIEESFAVISNNGYRRRGSSAYM